MIDKINQLLQEVEALKAANAEELEALRIKFLSKKGAINDLMADFRNVAAEQKKEVGTDCKLALPAFCPRSPGFQKQIVPLEHQSNPHNASFRFQKRRQSI